MATLDESDMTAIVNSPACRIMGVLVAGPSDVCVCVANRLPGWMDSLSVRDELSNDQVES